MTQSGILLPPKALSKNKQGRGYLAVVMAKGGRGHGLEVWHFVVGVATIS